MILYGLTGFSLSHSLSAEYFSRFFRENNMPDHEYRLFPIEKCEKIERLIRENPELAGLNVTIPFKKSILGYLDVADPVVAATGSANTIAIVRRKGRNILYGYNTDVYGFRRSLEPLLHRRHMSALILGTGGGAAAVAYVLRQLGIQFLFVSRDKTGSETVTYADLDKDLISNHLLIINATPSGMAPHHSQCPPLPYQHLVHKHLLFDLVYNPEETLFLKHGKVRGASVKNGLEMLYLQAAKSWEIWRDFEAERSSG